MSRSKVILALVCVLVVGAAGVSALRADNSADLAKKVEQLEQKLAELERRVESMAPPTPAMENEARTKLTQINSLLQQGNYEQAQSQMKDFKSKYSKTAAYKQALRLDQELSVFGKAAPASWSVQKWFQGESEVDLSSDKTTLLVFWELWCPHCKREVPKMQAMYEKYKGDGLQMVGLTKLTKSSTEDGVNQFIKAQGVKYPMAKEDGKLSAYFGVSGIPAAAVVKNGKVVWRGHPAKLSDAMVKGWL